MATCRTIWEARETTSSSTRWATGCAASSSPRARRQGQRGGPVLTTARARQRRRFTSSRLTWRMCALQSQDGKGVPSGSGFELSELMKRRLESVASTGSSASSGFIEDKSYCDSEEEEEGKGQARLASFPTPPPLPLCLCLLLSPSPLTSAPPLPHRNESPPQIVFYGWLWRDVSSSCSTAQSLQQEPLSPHWV